MKIAISHVTNGESSALALEVTTDEQTQPLTFKGDDLEKKFSAHTHALINQLIASIRSDVNGND